LQISLLEFFVEVLKAFWTVLPRMLVAWIIVFTVLVLGFGALKHRVRERVSLLDESVRHWAKGLRYRDPHNRTGERKVLTEFFRFMTHFASAPSLSTWSLLIPYVALVKVTTDTGAVRDTGLIGLIGAWLFPGLAYAGSMLLSFIMKRVFKRVRPPREEKAFGHNLKDASFPSGHSLTSFVFWISMSIVFFQATGFTGSTALFFVAAATIVALTGLSRVYLGVHFPSDVLGGYFIGAVWCLLCYLALSPVLKPIFIWWG